MNIQCINNIKSMPQSRKTAFHRCGPSPHQKNVDKLVAQYLELEAQKAQQAKQIAHQFSAHINRTQHQAAECVKEALGKLHLKK